MNEKRQSVVETTLFAVLFVVSFGFQPLFNSNQNTKFLHGIAQAGRHSLSQDWVANTVDPLPIFTALIKLIFSTGMPWLVYALQATLIFIYAVYSMLLAQKILRPISKTGFYAFLTLFFLLHSPIVFDDLYWGFSSQYLFVQYLQPSSFAVLYLPAIYYFVKKKYYLSALLMGIPGLFHAAYTLVSAMLFISCFSWLLFKQKKLLLIIGCGLLFSAVMLPSVITQLTLLQSTSQGLTEEAMRIISTYRIPHHTDVLSIFRFDFIIKSLVILLSIFLLKHQQIKWILIWLTAFLALAIGYGWLSKNAVVSVTTPWRLSVLVVPLGFTLFFAIICKKLEHVKLHQLSYVFLLGTVALSVSGFLWSKNEWKAYHDGYGMQTLRWIKENREQFSQATFLVESEGEYSERFRLETGLPIYINWKTHPYKDVEVIEWYERLQANNRFYNKEMSEQEKNDFLQKNKISYIVAPKSMQANQYATLFEGEDLKILQVLSKKPQN